MFVAILVVAGVLGLAIGSFLNVVIYRVPAGKSIVSPPSACPNCGAGIRRRDNVPVLSWLILRGKCRDCGAPISPRYPLVEGFTALAFVAVAALLAPAIDSATDVQQLVAALLVLVAYLYLAAVSIALALIDIDVHRLPNTIVLPSYVVGGVLLAGAAILSGEFTHLIGAAIAAAALFVAYFLLRFAYPRGMGFGDVKLAGVLGLYLGWIGLGAVVVGAFAPFVIGGLFAIALLIARRANRKSRIPFGPWMLLGAWVGIVAGETIFAGYLRVVGLG